VVDALVFLQEQHPDIATKRDALLSVVEEKRTQYQLLQKQINTNLQQARYWKSRYEAQQSLAQTTGANVPEDILKDTSHTNVSFKLNVILLTFIYNR
jgi:hypothetical protein